MKKNLTLVVNPRSSGFELIRKKILPFLDETHFEKGSFKTLEIQPTSPMETIMLIVFRKIVEKRQLSLLKH